MSSRFRSALAPSPKTFDSAPLRSCAVTEHGPFDGCRKAILRLITCSDWAFFRRTRIAGRHFVETACDIMIWDQGTVPENRDIFYSEHAGCKTESENVAVR